MAAPYSTDLRRRAVSAALKGEMTRAEVARQFDISEATLYIWLRRWKKDASLEPLPHAGGPQPSLDAEGMKQLADMVEQDNDRTIDEYRTAVEERLGVQMGRSSVHRALQKLKLRRKKDVASR